MSEVEKTEPQSTPPAPQKAPERKPNPRDQKRRTPSDPRFNDRVKRLAQDLANKQLARVGKALGLETFDLAEFEKKIAGIEKEREEGKSVAEKVDGRIQQMHADNVRLRDEVAKLKGELVKFRKDRERLAREKEHIEIESEIRLAAHRSGIHDDPDYAIELFRRHVQQSGNGDQKPEEFFKGLKSEKKYRHLFAEEAVPAGPPQGDRQPPRSQIPPQGAPPATAQEAQKETNVAEMDENGKPRMSDREFRKYAAQKYGFSALG